MPTPMMRVVQFHGYGGPEQLKLEEQPRPEPSPSEVQLRVHAAGVNALDWKLRQGLMQGSQPVAFPYVPGIEAAGVVETVGSEVTAFEIGQAVYRQVASGAYAEYLTTPAKGACPQTGSLELCRSCRRSRGPNDHLANTL
jgi:NADPH:quinone reductase-like Zn-dependent oxidoreductase